MRICISVLIFLAVSIAALHYFQVDMRQVGECIGRTIYQIQQGFIEGYGG